MSCIRPPEAFGFPTQLFGYYSKKKKNLLFNFWESYLYTVAMTKKLSAHYYGNMLYIFLFNLWEKCTLFMKQGLFRDCPSKKDISYHIVLPF